MQLTEAETAKEIAAVASRLQTRRTEHAPKAVTVVSSDNTLVITFQEALMLAETALAIIHDGAAKVKEFHRELFRTSSAEWTQRQHRPVPVL